MKINAKVTAVLFGLTVGTSAIAGTATNPQLADPSLAVTTQSTYYSSDTVRGWDVVRIRPGLTSEQVNSTYGDAPTPNYVKSASDDTNPTGTELKGENSGGQ